MIRQFGQVTILTLFLITFSICPFSVNAMEKPEQVALGYAHSGAIKSDGTFWMWGSNSSGCLGDGSNENSTKPKQVLEDVAKVVLGDSCSAAIKKDGTLWMWGYNAGNRLGTTSSSMTTPQQVFDDVSDVQIGDSFTIVLRTDGTLWGWGANGSEQLGIGSREDSSTPIQIMSDVD